MEFSPWGSPFPQVVPEEINLWIFLLLNSFRYEMCCFVTTKFGNEVAMVYQVQDTWCISMGLQEKMDKCVTYLKENWVGNCLSKAFIFLPNGPPPPKLKVRGTTFHNMQIKEDEWVNPLVMMGMQFWGKKSELENDIRVYI